MMRVILLFTVIACGCVRPPDCPVCGTYSGSYGEITLLADGRYEAAVVAGHNTYHHVGKWNRMDTVVYFTSDSFPTWKHLIQVISKTDTSLHPDSICLEIHTTQGVFPFDSNLIVMPPRSVEINRLRYRMNGTKTTCLKFPETVGSILVHGFHTDYPLVEVSNDSVEHYNRFLIQLMATPNNVRKPYRYRSYFFNEPFIWNGEQLVDKDGIKYQKSIE